MLISCVAIEKGLSLDYNTPNRKIFSTSSLLLAMLRANICPAKSCLTIATFLKPL